MPNTELDSLASVWRIERSVSSKLRSSVSGVVESCAFAVSESIHCPSMPCPGVDS
jgi:hypothetical protein